MVLSSSVALLAPSPSSKVILISVMSTAIRDMRAMLVRSGVISVVIVMRGAHSLRAIVLVVRKGKERVPSWNLPGAFQEPSWNLLGHSVG